MTDRLTWGENYLQILFKVAPENLVEGRQRSRYTSVYVSENMTIPENFRTICELFNKLATKKSRWHLLPVARIRQEGPLEKYTAALSRRFVNLHAAFHTCLEAADANVHSILIYNKSFK